MQRVYNIKPQVTKQTHTYVLCLTVSVKKDIIAKMGRAMLTLLVDPDLQSYV